ncbi:MAG: hypothetical protein ACFFFT_11180 [Candidatus Thorarchaeota archaeon]
MDKNFEVKHGLFIVLRHEDHPPWLNKRLFLLKLDDAIIQLWDETFQIITI